MRGSWDEKFATDPWAIDPESQEVGSRRRPLKEMLAAPIGWLFHSVVGVLSFLILLTTAPPGWAVVPFLGLAVLLVGCGLVWLIRLCVHAGTRRVDGSGRSWRPFLVAPVLVVAAAGLVVLEAPTRVGFELSRDQFQLRADEIVGEGGEGHITPLAGERVGLFAVDTIRLDGDVVMFETGAFFFSLSGFAYSPDERAFADHPYSNDVVSLGGGWYAYTIDFD